MEESADALSDPRPEPGDTAHDSDRTDSTKLGVEPADETTTTPDIDMARALLSFGSKGIELWNAHRARTKGRCELDNIDLSHLDMSNANLENCSLRHANLSASNLSNVDLRNSSLRNANLAKATVYGAKADDADFAGANLSSARLDVSSFKRCRLLNARLSGASLRWCDFASADLRNANLEGASLDPCYLGDADLTGAQFSSKDLDAIKAGVSLLESAGDHPRSVFFALLGACVFSAVTALGASEVSLVAGRGYIKVPLLDTDVSPRGFFLTAPVVCAAFMLYVAIHIRQLEKAARELPARFSDGSTLAEKLSPWLQIIAPSRVARRAVHEDGSDLAWKVPALSRQSLALSTRWLVPVTTTLMFVTYSRARHVTDLRIVGALALCTWVLAYFAWQPISGRRRRGAPHLSFSLLLAAGATFAWWGAQRSTGPLQGLNADLGGLTLADLTLRKAQLSHADLRRSVFDHVDLTGAVLLGAKLTDSGAHGLNLSSARLTGADCSNSYFSDTDLSNAQLVNVQFHDAELSDSSLSGADLSGANFHGATFRCVNVRNTNLANAQTDGLVVLGLFCDDRTKFPEGIEGQRLAAQCGNQCAQTGLRVSAATPSGPAR